MRTLPGALVLAVSAGCSSAAPPPADLVVVAPKVSASTTAEPVQVATSAYEPWTGAQGGAGCTVRALAQPGACGRAGRCPVLGHEAASCAQPVSEVTMADGSVAFAIVPGQPDQTGGFAYWPRGAGEVRIGWANGDDPHLSAGGSGPPHLLRIEQEALVDYRLDAPSLLRRRWPIKLPIPRYLLRATASDRGLVALLGAPYEPSYEVLATPDGRFAHRAALTPSGEPFSLIYDGHGVRVSGERAEWALPVAVTSTAAFVRVVMHAAGARPVFAFLSSGDGVQVLLPEPPLTPGALVHATALSFPMGHVERTSDCPDAPSEKAVPCRRVEIDPGGPALAQGADGRLWVAYVIVTREHRARARRVCPPPPRCTPPRPCRLASCELVERDVHDTVRNEIAVWHLAPEGDGAELVYRDSLVDLHVIGQPELSTVSSELVVAFRAGSSEVRRIRLDTAALRPLPVGADAALSSEVELGGPGP